MRRGRAQIAVEQFIEIELERRKEAHEKEYQEGLDFFDDRDEM